MRRHISAGLIITACALAGCGGGDSSAGNGYPKSVEDNFVKSCDAQPGATKPKCQCAFDRIKANVPFDDFKKADADLRAGKSADPKTQKALQEAVKACR